MHNNENPGKEVPNMRNYYSTIDETVLTFSNVEEDKNGFDSITFRFERPNNTGFDFAEGKLPENRIYKSYGFSKGGVVRKGIPASILDMIGGDALIPRGDSMLIGANPGETVLTEEFTKQLKPTAQILNEFNRRMAQTTMEPSAAVQNKTTEITSENHFIFNNPVIKSEEDAEKLMEKAIQKHMDRNRRDWKKVR